MVDTMNRCYPRTSFVSTTFNNYMIKRYLAARSLSPNINGVELSGVGTNNIPGWRSNIDRQGADIVVLHDKRYKDICATELYESIQESLDRIHPDVVAVLGWSNKGALAALSWTVRNNKQAILMSDSAEKDEKRTLVKELVKRRIIASFAAALVAGKPHKEYVIKLGMHPDKIFTGFDVVDNEYFSTEAEKIRNESKKHRNRYGLPAKYFLSSKRFIPKKNISRLLKAYSKYQQQAHDPWMLVLLGDGQLRPEVERQITELALCDSVVLPGFKPYGELPIYYALAQCYIQASLSEQWGLVVNEAMACGLPVLVSEMCGCQEDLVEEGENGFVFDPYNVDDMCEKMIKISSGDCDLKKMGHRSEEIISNWSCDTFAENFWLAADCATRNPVSPSWISKMCVNALIHR